MIATFAAGIVAGVVHVVSGPDHLVAVAPLAAKTRRRAWSTGVRWGLGHTAGVSLVAGLAILVREILPLETLSGWSERLVGVVLIGIGLWAIKSALGNRAHLHKHEHEGVLHSHFHLHEKDTEHSSSHAHVHTHAAFGVGALHGLAGSSHFLAVLPALALPTRSAAGSYLAGYGVGSVLSMALFALMVGHLSSHLGSDQSKAYRGALSAFGAVAVLVGVFWVVT